MGRAGRQPRRRRAAHPRPHLAHVQLLPLQQGACWSARTRPATLTTSPLVLTDLRVCFVGDSFVAGVGDPQHLGWTGRIAARTYQAGQPLTSYVLGVR